MTDITGHLHTYFLFPFSVDRDTVFENHREQWEKYEYWIDGFDEWIAAHHVRSASPVIEKLGAWQRTPYRRFDMNSQAYQDMVFFLPVVRRTFFDTTDPSGATAGRDSQLRCYAIPLGGKKVFLDAVDRRGRRGRVQVTDLRLFLFSNGIGILSLGVESPEISVPDALWVNEMMRKVYPSSGRQIREGRTPSLMRLTLVEQDTEEPVVEEQFRTAQMIGFQPPLSRIITSLLYFLDYLHQEFEPVLDERMIVYSFYAINPATLPEGFVASEEFQILLSRFLYVDRYGTDYRYERAFTRALMRKHVYRRWAHQGTYYGFTSYSNLTLTIGTFDCDDHKLEEGFLIHRMFVTRYYLMALIALFYRATLLDFSERTALVAKYLFREQIAGRLSPEILRIAADLRADFIHFSNYWHFNELANKDEEIEHFQMQCRSYRIPSMKSEVEQEIEKLDASIFEYYQRRNTQAVNRLAMLSGILGGAAVLTGFFGMNFGHKFSDLVFEPTLSSYVFWGAVAFACITAFGALLFGATLVIVNWADYRDILIPSRREKERRLWPSLRKIDWSEDSAEEEE